MMSMFTTRVRFPLPLLYGILFTSALFGCATAGAKRYPTGNVNLSPFDKWLNAYRCLNTVSCEANYQLTYWGWKNLTSADTQEYCRPGGCKDLTLNVISCISLVKPDFKFVDRTTVKDVNNTIIQGCATGFNGTVIKTSSAGSLTQGIFTVVVTTLVSVFLLLSVW